MQNYSSLFGKEARERIEKHKDYVLAAFLDTKRSFDETSYDAITTALAKHDVENIISCLPKAATRKCCISFTIEPIDKL